jgi:hypothetical protein
MGKGQRIFKRGKGERKKGERVKGTSCREKGNQFGERKRGRVSLDNLDDPTITSGGFKPSLFFQALPR